MSDRQPDDIDRLLEAAGDRWRSSLAGPADVDANWFTNEQRGIRHAPWLAAAAALAILALVVALFPRTAPIGPSAAPESPLAALPTPGTTAQAPPNSSPRATPTTTLPLPTSTSTAPAFPYDIVREGDLVSVSGAIIDWSAGPIICTWEAWDLSNPPQPGCVDSHQVPISGIEPRELPGNDWRSAREDFNEVWVTDHVQLFGLWRGGIIDYVGSVPTDKPPSPSFLSVPPIPCDPPSGGWPGDPEDFAPEGPEGLVLSLQAEVDRRPEIYGGFWVAWNEDTQGNVTERALVVGTVGDVESAARSLTEIFPANLCVVEVEYSTAELQVAVDDLTQNGDNWTVGTDPATNRVLVILPVIDEQAAEALAPHVDKIDVRPLAEKADTAPPPNGERICGRLEQGQCDVVIALVREAQPDVLAPDATEIAEYICPPGALTCPPTGATSYLVAVVPAGCSGGPISFRVHPRHRYERVVESEYALPAHIAELLPADCVIDPPT